MCAPFILILNIKILLVIGCCTVDDTLPENQQLINSKLALNALEANVFEKGWLVRDGTCQDGN